MKTWNYEQNLKTYKANDKSSSKLYARITKPLKQTTSQHPLQREQVKVTLP